MRSVDVWVLRFGPDKDVSTTILKKVFGLDDKTAAQIVSSAPVVLKKGIQPGLALALSGALRDAGAHVRVVRAGSPQPSDSTPEAPEVQGKKPLKVRKAPEEKPARKPTRAKKAPEEKPADKATAQATPPKGDSGVKGASATERASIRAPAAARTSDAEADKATARAKSQRRLLAVLLVLLGFGIGFMAWWFVVPPPSPHTSVLTTEQVDRLADSLLADPNHEDARQWLDRGDFLYMSRAQARQLVDTLQDAGASRIVAADLTTIGRGEGMAAMVAELPSSNPRRVVEAAREATGLGPGGEPMVRDMVMHQGNRYLVIAFR